MLNQKLIITILLISICISLSACNKKIEPIRKTSLALGTIVDITVFDKKDEKALENVMQQISKYDNIFNSHIDDSEVSKFNKLNANTDFKMSNELEYVVSKALEYSKISDGKFDVSIYPVSHLWDFTSMQPHMPDKNELENSLQYVGYKNIKYDNSKSSIKKVYDKCAMDLGGIAKGYIADQIAKYFKENNVKRAIINLGGNVYALGSKTDNSLWNVGIQKPFDDVGTPLGVVKIKDMAVVTSGIYERQFFENDQAYHHILDPKTGYPYNNELSAVSIISTSAIDADALSTITYMLGPKDGLAYIENLPNTEAIFITKNNEIILSSGMVDNFKCLDDSFSLINTPK